MPAEALLARWSLGGIGAKAGDADHRGAENVPRIEKFNTYVAEVKGFVVSIRLPQAKRAVHIRALVQDNTAAAFIFLVHDSERIGEHGRRELFGGCRRIDNAFESVVYELGYSPDVIGVGMRHDERVDTRRIVCEWVTICRITHVLTFDSAAIDKNFLCTGIKKKIRAGHRARSPIECNSCCHDLLRVLKYATTPPSMSMSRSLAVSSG